MIPRPIYIPKARAREYGDYACNIYRGCNHGCVYCFAPGVLRMSREEFSNVTVRQDIVESVKQQLDRERIAGKLLHLCFTCDPYPADIDTTPTRGVIRVIKESGNHVQILTKGGVRAGRDFDLLDENDWFGVTYTGATKSQEPKTASGVDRIWTLVLAKERGLNTWVSCEPVLNPGAIYELIAQGYYIDKFKIGKLNHYRPEDLGLAPIDWAAFGRECERLCKLHRRNYYLKEDLRREMEAASI